MTPSKKIRELYAEGYQLTPEAFEYLNNLPDIDGVIDKILISKTDKAILSVEDIDELLGEYLVKEDAIAEQPLPKKEEVEITEQEILQIEEKKETLEEKVKPDVETETKLRKVKVSSDLEIIFSPEVNKFEASSQSFRNYFESRFQSIYQLFAKRRDITNKVSTKDLIPNRNRDKISVIAMVTKIHKTRKGTVILDLEDQTGMITGIIHSSKQDLITKSEFILEDSILCFTGNWWKDVLSIDGILWPDIPYHKSNFADDDVYALFISDIHVGSKNFAEDLFTRVIKFVNGKLESDGYNEIGKKIKYLLVGGDVVDGVGIYPGQIEDLEQTSIHLQYKTAANFFEKIRDDVEIVIIPGNHDAARAAEPQTPIQRNFAPDLYDLDNVHLLGSPCYLKAHNVEIMMHHGNSILDINAAIPAISHETSIPAMVRMLENRHIVPIYGKRTPIAPESEDRLFISRIPDIFQTGHTHIAGDETYKGVTLINSGTFQYQTSYQKSMNINPTTGQTYFVNLKSIQRTQINFQEMN